MKQFFPYLLYYLAKNSQINYSHLRQPIHYSGCKHISQMKCLGAHLAFLIFRAEDNKVVQRFKAGIKETAPCTCWDTLSAASSTDSHRPGSFNVWDLSVSISRVISLVHLAAAAAAHSFCRSVSTCSQRPTFGWKRSRKTAATWSTGRVKRRIFTLTHKSN